MTPGAHLLISWLATVEILNNRRERTLVAISGFAPDLDGIGIVCDKITGVTNYYLDFHHYMGHSIISAIFLSSLATLLAKTQKIAVFILSLLVVHLHFFCDIVGSRGPDGYQWPVYYFYPMDRITGYTWKYQWELNAWQNQLVMFFLICFSVYYLIRRNVTFFEVFSKRLDAEAVRMYKKYVLKNA